MMDNKVQDKEFVSYFADKLFNPKTTITNPNLFSVTRREDLTQQLYENYLSIIFNNCITELKCTLDATNLNFCNTRTINIASDSSESYVEKPTDEEAEFYPYQLYANRDKTKFYYTWYESTIAPPGAKPTFNRYICEILTTPVESYRINFNIPAGELELCDFGRLDQIQHLRSIYKLFTLASRYYGIDYDPVKFGDYFTRLEKEAANSRDRRIKIITKIIEPTMEVSGKWVSWPTERAMLAEAEAAVSKLNYSQQNAVKGINSTLEMIQGPPGTGKSTTISKIIETRLWNQLGARPPQYGEPIEHLFVIVTAKANEAIISILDKLASNEKFKENILVVASSKWLVKNPSHLAKVKQYLYDPNATYDDGSTQGNIPRAAVRWSNADRDSNRHPLREKLSNIKIILSTVGMIHNVTQVIDILNENRNPAIFKTLFIINTVIVDEAGQLTESEALYLIERTSPDNLLMVGDQKQLPAFSDCTENIDGTGNHTPEHSQLLQKNLDAESYNIINTSVFERCFTICETSYNPPPYRSPIWMLNEQYRMPSKLGNVVSTLF